MNELIECSKCHLPKDALEFRKYRTYCKGCENLQNKEYKQNHKNEIKTYNKEYRVEHKEEAKKYTKQYRIENIDDIKAYRRSYQKEKRRTNPAYKLKQSVSTYINIMLKSNNSSKNGESCLKYLPYSLEKLKEHLESLFEPWMTWDNWGLYNWQTWNDNDPATWTWHVDHITPQSDLPYTSMKDDNFTICWALENLRPLNAKQNISEGPARIRHKKAV